MKKILIALMCVIIVVCFMPTVAFAADGDNQTVNEPVDVSDFEGFKSALEDAADANSGDTTINFTADIAVPTGQNWSAVNIDGYHGADIITIHGNGHKITGLNAPLFSGGFAGGSGLVIDGLTIDGANINDSTNTLGIGAFISCVDSMDIISLTDCHLVNSTIASNAGARVGGLIGWTAGYNVQDDGPVDTFINVTNCSVENTSITAAGSVGAIIGHAGSNPATYHTIKGCTVTGCNLNSTDDGGWRVGVVVGTANLGQVTIEKITESGNTITQTGKTAPTDHGNLYGRFVPDETSGVLVIDGTAIGGGASAAAMVDGVYYGTLAEAINAAQSNSIVTLLEDSTSENGIIVKKENATITLDLNNKTFTVTGGSNANNRAFRIDAGTLNVKGPGTLIAAGSGTTSSNGTGAYGVFRVEENGVLNVTNATLQNSRPWGLNVKVCGGVANLSNVEIISSYGGGIEVTEKALGEKSQKGSAKLTNCKITQTGYFDHCSSAVSVSGGSTLIVDGGTYTSEGTGIYVFSSGGDITIKDGKFGGGKQVVRAEIDTDTYPEYSGSVRLEGGEFDGAFKIKAPASLSISGGYFTADPSKYLADGKVAVASDVADYTYMTADKAADAADNVEQTTGTPKVNVESIDESKRDEVKAAAEATDVQQLGALAGTEAAKITETQATELKRKFNKTPAEGETITLYVQTFLDVIPKTLSGESYTIDITPKMQIIASTAGNATEIALDGQNKNAEIVQDAGNIDVETPVTVSIQVPSSFDINGSSVYVSHKKASGKTYIYDVAVSEKNGHMIATFNNPHGFSEFTITKNAPVAKIGDIGYASLQEAVDNVGNGETITLQKDDNSTIVVSKNISFILEVAVGINFTGTIGAGSGYTVTNSGNAYTVKTITQSTGGGGAPAAQKPTIEAAEGIKVTLSTDGTTATITVEEGYEITDVTVNGVSKGAVTTVSGLKTGDKLVVTAAKKGTSLTEEEQKKAEAIRGFKLIAKSKLTKTKSGKKAIRITWNTSEYKFDGVEVWRSTKRNSGYGNKPMWTIKAKNTKYYYNTAIKKGKTYYYKLRGYVEINGQKYYTPFSSKAYRTVR